MSKQKHPKAKEAIEVIESLFPPDSVYPMKAERGRLIMDEAVGNSVGHNYWQDLPDRDLIVLAIANLMENNNLDKAAEMEKALEEMDNETPVEIRYFIICTAGTNPNGSIALNAFKMQTEGEHPSLKNCVEHSYKRIPHVREQTLISISEISPEDWKDFLSEQ